MEKLKESTIEQLNSADPDWKRVAKFKELYHDHQEFELAA